MSNKYRCAISYYDQATHFVGLLFIDVTAESPEDASRNIDGAKRDKGWLVTAFGSDFDPDDFHPAKDGIIVGEHVVIELTMKNYLVALKYRELADDYTHFVLVEVASHSAEQASQEVERCKGDRQWLLAAFRTRDPKYLDGIVVGEHIVIGTVVADDRRAPGIVTR